MVSVCIGVSVCIVLLQGEQSASGPNLFGVFGRRVADDSNYQQYSLAVLYKDIVWNENNLFTFLHAPRKFIPGTKMVFPGIQSGKDRKGITVVPVLNYSYLPPVHDLETQCIH